MNENKELGLERCLRLSPTQSMFWVVQMLTQDKTTLNHTGVYRVTGRIRIGDLRAAVRAVGQRHEALRTCFFEEDGQVLQGIRDSITPELEHKQLAGQDVGASVKSNFAALLEHVFDLGRGEVMRIVLLTTPSLTESYLLIGTHHINTDGNHHARPRGLLHRPVCHTPATLTSTGPHLNLLALHFQPSNAGNNTFARYLTAARAKV